MQLNELTRIVQDAIFEAPDIATGVGGWQLKHTQRGPTMMTNQRPDGSVTPRNDKMCLYFRPEGYLFLSYNGGSFKSCAIWNLLRTRYNEKDFIPLLRRLCDDYHINFNLDGYDSCSISKPKMKVVPKASNPPMSIPIIGDETGAAVIPGELVAKYLDYTRDDQLRTYLNGILDPLVLEGVWHEYGVGIAQDGRPVFFYYDRAGRCRDGKVMRYTSDGHRDRETNNSILAVPFLLQRSGHLPTDAVFDGILYGEHLLSRYPSKPIALVEAEKTALIATTTNPEFCWLATGGMNRKLDRAVALLSGQGVRVFPDEDAFNVWSKYFTRTKGFIISDLSKRLVTKVGPAWNKCDIGDFIIEYNNDKNDNNEQTIQETISRSF